MTVGTENAFAFRNWTGGETSFTPGFSALAAADVLVYSRDEASGLSTQLVLNTHYSVTIDAATGAVTVTPIALPAAPKTLLILRNTPALQDTNFANLGSYQPGVHTRRHDAAALRDGEEKFHRARALKAPLGETMNDLARVADRASRYPKFDAAGQMVPGGLVADIEGGAVAGQEHAAAAAASANRVAGFVALANSLYRRVRKLLDDIALSVANAPAQTAGFATLAQQAMRSAKYAAARIAGAASQAAAFASVAQEGARVARRVLGQVFGAANSAAGFATIAETAARKARAAAASVFNTASAVAGHAAAAATSARRAKTSAAAAAASAASIDDLQIVLKARVFN